MSGDSSASDQAATEQQQPFWILNFKDGRLSNSTTKTLKLEIRRKMLAHLDISVNNSRLVQILQIVKHSECKLLKFMGGDFTHPVPPSDLCIKIPARWPIEYHRNEKNSWLRRLFVEGSKMHSCQDDLSLEKGRLKGCNLTHDVWADSIGFQGSGTRHTRVGFCYGIRPVTQIIAVHFDIRWS